MISELSLKQYFKIPRYLELQHKPIALIIHQKFNKLLPIYLY